MKENANDNTRSNDQYRKKVLSLLPKIQHYVNQFLKFTAPLIYIIQFTYFVSI